MGWLWRAARGRPPSDRETLPANAPRLREALAYIAGHFDEPLSLRQLAGVAHASPTHLSRLFRDATGLSPFQYVHRYRMQRAKELLTQTDASVAAIANQVGFADPFYFSRAFKRSEGLSPRDFRGARRSTPYP